MVFPCRMRSTHERGRLPSSPRSSSSGALARRWRRRSSRRTRRLRTARSQVLGLFQRGSWPRRACPHPYPGPRTRPKQDPFPPTSFWSTSSTVLRAPRTPSQHGDTSPSAYSHRLRPTWAAGEGLSCSIPGLRYVPPPVPRGRPAALRSHPSRSLLPSPRHDRLGRPAFRCLSHEAAEIHSRWARSFASSAGPYGPVKAFDAPLRRPDLSGRPEPATRRTRRAYRGGTPTRWSGVASRPPPGSTFRTRHE